MKLTDAQQRGLEYFKFLELPAEERAALVETLSLLFS